MSARFGIAHVLRLGSVGRMDAEELRSFCLSRPTAVEDFPFSPGVSVFRLRAREGKKGKMFALSQLEQEPLKVSVKIDPELGESLRASYESIEPGYHLNKRHWVTITLNERRRRRDRPRPDRGRARARRAEAADQALTLSRARIGSAR